LGDVIRMLSDIDNKQIHFDKPIIYTLSHIILGIIAVWYPILGLLFIAYQILEYILNIRFFLFSMEIKEGNSLLHTMKKLGEIGSGYIIGLIIISIPINLNLDIV
jgi:hypothetical protein